VCRFGPEVVTELRVGVVGCGRHSTRVTLPGLAGAGFHLAATCSRRLAVAVETAGRFGADHAYDDPAAMVESVELDALVLVLPRFAYRSVFDQVAPAGLPTLLEKPGAASAAELDAIEACASAPVLVGYMKRFAPAYAPLRERAPPAAAMHVQMAVGPWPGEVDDLVFEVACHAVDLAQFVLGPLAVVGATRGPRDTPMHLTVELAGRGGTLATAEVSTTAAWDDQRESVSLTGPGWEARVDQGSVGPPAPGVPGSEGFAVELEHFAGVVRGRAPSAVPVAAARQTMRLLEDVVARLR
jgi:predicted dehydrogenase